MTLHVAARRVALCSIASGGLGWDATRRRNPGPCRHVGIHPPPNQICALSWLRAAQDYLKPPPLELVRGVSTVQCESAKVNGPTLECLVEMTVKVMRNRGWAGVGSSAINVKDVSGIGGSKTYKITAPGFHPESVALHSRDEQAVGDPLLELRMAACAKVFFDAGLAPPRIYQCKDWYLELWEGTGQPSFVTEADYARLGTFLAKAHKIPTDWFNEWRVKLKAAEPRLSSVPDGSHLWWWACKPLEWLAPVPDTCFTEFAGVFHTPRTAAAQRIVTTHGDLHAQNMLETSDGLKCLDFEFGCVSYALLDLSYICRWMTLGWTGPRASQDLKRVFLRAYLEAMGESSAAQDVDDLLVDCEIGWLGYHVSLMRPFLFGDRQGDESAVAALRLRCQAASTVVQGIREGGPFRYELLASGFQVDADRTLRLAEARI